MKHFGYDFSHILTKLPIPQAKSVYLDLYQENCRIYMDEYPEGTEVDLRVNFDTSLLMKRFTEKL